MFKLIIRDRKGETLSLGDLVKISDGKFFNFYCKLKYDAERKVLHPFHTFSFHSIEKASEIPEGAVKAENRDSNDCEYWYVPYNKVPDLCSQRYEKYLMGWRACETPLEKAVFLIEPM